MKYGKHAKEDRSILNKAITFLMLGKGRISNMFLKKDTKKSNRFLVFNKIKPKTLCIVLSMLIVITTTVAFVVHKITYTEEYANKKMMQLVTKYFERDIKENVTGVGRLIVTLQTLKDAGFNIKSVSGKPGVSKDLSKAFSYVIIENPGETEKEKIIYTIKNHLNGE